MRSVILQTLIGALLLLFGAESVLAQAKLSEKQLGPVIEKAVKAYMTESKAVGISLGIYDEGKTYTYNYGLTERSGNKRPDEHSLYEMASITKTFAGVLLADAAVEKKVNLDDDIRKYLDGNYPNLEYRGQPIRLFHLLNHRSGMPNWLPDTPGMLPNTNTPAEWTDARVAEVLKNYTRKDFYRDLHNVRLEAIPGTRASYSNAAAQLLGYILERVYGMTFEDLLKEKITKPLEMADTTIMLNRSQRERLVKGYSEDGTSLPYTPEKVQAAGALKSTVADMLKYVRWQADEKDEAVRLTHRPTWSATDISYSAGLNWQMWKDAKGNRLIWQSGNLGGFSSICAIYPELKMGIVILTNVKRGKLSSLANKIMQSLDPKTIPLP